MSTLTPNKCPVVEAQVEASPVRPAFQYLPDQQSFGNGFLQESMPEPEESSWLDAVEAGLSEEENSYPWSGQADEAGNLLREEDSKTGWKNPNWPSVWDYAAAAGIVPQEFADNPASTSWATWPGKVDALLSPLTAAASLTSCEDPEWWSKTATIGLGAADGVAGLAPTPRPSSIGYLPELVEVGEGASSQTLRQASAPAIATVEEALAKAPNSKTKFAETPIPGLSQDAVLERVPGEVYDPKRLAELTEYLRKRGVELTSDGSGLFPHQAGAFYYGETPSLRLRENPTQYEVWHELGHFLQYRQLGPEGYAALPRPSYNPATGLREGFNAPEQFVFDLLENSPKRWQALSSAERAHANEYIVNCGGIR